jgi:hypothetical protein
MKIVQSTEKIISWRNLGVICYFDVSLLTIIAIRDNIIICCAWCKIF